MIVLYLFNLFMINNLQNLVPCELSLCCRDEYRVSDSLYSFPDGFCFLYALAYRLGMFGHKAILSEDYPDVLSVRKWLMKRRTRIPTASLDQFDELLSSEKNAYRITDDSLLKLTYVCACELDGYQHSLVYSLTSDLWAVLGPKLWHIYYNPEGDPSKALIGYDVPYAFGAQPMKLKKGEKLVFIPKMNQNKKTAQPKPKQQAPKAKQRNKRRITPAGQLLRKVGGIAGGFLGNESLGRSLGAGISRIFGQGDYSVKSNSLMGSGPPSFSPLNAGIRITHREYLTDILSSTNYAVRTYRLQPAASSSFPWLSQLANSFEQYKMNGCVVYLNTTSGNAISSTNNSLGVWGVTTVYDPSRPPLPNKLAAEEYMGCTAGVPSCSILHPVECKPKSDVLERYYVDYSNKVSGEQLKFYDHGLVNVFTQGQQQANVNLGELWISYDITFYNPRIEPVAEDALADHYSLSGITITATNPMGSGGTVSPTTGSGLGTTVTTGGSGFATLNIPANISSGVYMVAYFYAGGNAVANISLAISALTSNLTSLNLFSAGAFSGYIAPFPTTATQNNMALLKAFTKTDNNAASIQIGSGSNVLPSGHASTTLDVFVIPLGQIITMMKKSANDELKTDLFEAMKEYIARHYQSRPFEQPELLIKEDDDSLEAI